MKNRLATIAAVFLWTAVPLPAHRLDEYLQATILSVQKDRVQAEMRLTPGVAVLPEVLSNIDTNGDGLISNAEQRTYAERVLRDLSFRIDGDRLTPHLVSLTFPAMEEIKEGLGEILLEIYVDLPRKGPNRRLAFENFHDSRIGAYLVNCLVPRDPDIRITGQNRNYTQSFYQLDFVDTSVRSTRMSFGWLWETGKPAGTAAFLVFAWLAVFLKRRSEVR